MYQHQNSSGQQFRAGRWTQITVYTENSVFVVIATAHLEKAVFLPNTWAMLSEPGLHVICPIAVQPKKYTS